MEKLECPHCKKEIEAGIFLRHEIDTRFLDKYLEKREFIKSLVEPREERGPIVAPRYFTDKLIGAINKKSTMREICRCWDMDIDAEYVVPELEADPMDEVWTAETICTDRKNTDEERRHLKPHPVVKRAKISHTLIRLDEMGLDDLIIKRVVLDFCETENKAFMTGNGEERPLGIFSPYSLSEHRNVEIDFDGKRFDPDGFYDALYGLKAKYRRNAKWIFNRDAVRLLRPLKNGRGEYMWVPGIAPGEKDKFLGLPIYENEYCPTMGEFNTYFGVIGDFSHYAIVTERQTSIEPLFELYADMRQTGYLVRMKIDGMPINDQAFIRLKAKKI